MTRLTLLFIFTTSIFFGYSQDSLVIMSFNCEFMWDGVEPEEGQVEFIHKGKPEMAARKMEQIAEIIKRYSPDIVNLVEVENKQTLDMLNNEYLNNAGYQVYFVKGTDSFTGQDVAMLSKLDLNSYERYKEKGKSGETEKSVSKNYYATYVNGNTKLAFIGLHFLSRPDDESRKHPRQAQADAIRNIGIKLIDDGYQLVVMGDFNDFDGDSTCIDINNNSPVTTVLRDIKEMNGDTSDDDLVNVASIIPKYNRYTSHWDKNNNHVYQFPQEVSSIDHILVSNELSQHIGWAYIDHTMNPLETSDHFPIIVKIGLVSD